MGLKVFCDETNVNVKTVSKMGSVELLHEHLLTRLTRATPQLRFLCKNKG